MKLAIRFLTSYTHSTRTHCIKIIKYRVNVTLDTTGSADKIKPSLSSITFSAELPSKCRLEVVSFILFLRVRSATPAEKFYLFANGFRQLIKRVQNNPNHRRLPVPQSVTAMSARNPLRYLSQKI